LNKKDFLSKIVQLTGFASMEPVQYLRFGPFRLDVRTGELRKRDTRIRLRPQSLDLLMLLLDHPGELVLRDEIRSKLWPLAAAGDFDQGINAAMRGLRTALMDSAEGPTWVETLPKRGYRFIGTVERVGYSNTAQVQVDRSAAEAGEAGDLADELMVPEEVPSESPFRRPFPATSPIQVKTAGRQPIRSLVWILLFTILACGAAVAVWRPFRSLAPMAGTLVVSRVTATGDIVQADVSYNGESVAYVRETQGHQSLWLKQFSKEGDVQLADCGEKRCGGPTFSPDATAIYFTRRASQSPEGTLYRLSVLGGAPEPILSGISGTPALSSEVRWPRRDRMP
jgi:DNA-binding winged helix-turn-helix (wHTH) protein